MGRRNIWRDNSHTFSKTNKPQNQGAQRPPNRINKFKTHTLTLQTPVARN